MISIQPPCCRWLNTLEHRHASLVSSHREVTDSFCTRFIQVTLPTCTCRVWYLVISCCGLSPFKYYLLSFDMMFVGFHPSNMKK